MNMTLTLVMIMAMIVTLTICEILILVMVMMGMNVEGQRRLCFGKCRLCKVSYQSGWVGVGVGGWFWLKIRNGSVEPFNNVDSNITKANFCITH